LVPATDFLAAVFSKSDDFGRHASQVSARYDLVIVNARLRGHGRTRCIGISRGTIAYVGDESLDGDIVLDAEGNLVTESFVDPHLHLCKVYTLDMLGDRALREYTSPAMRGARTAIELASEIKESYDESWIYTNARRAVRDGIRNGVTHIQAFADTDTKARLEAIKALLRLRGEFSNVVDIKVVAFPQDGIVRDPGAADYVRQALEMGADVVGGIPWIEPTQEDARRHIDQMLDLAVEFDKPVAMLVDDAGDPELRTTEMLAAAAIDLGLAGRVTACHARAMNTYPEDYFGRLVTLLDEARMGFVTDPHTGSLCTRALALDGHGITVALGQDDILDAYYPFGQHNMLEVAFLASHILGASTREDMERLLDMVTTRAADVAWITQHRLQVGAPANLVVLNGRDAREVLTRHLPPRLVVSNGEVVATTSMETAFGETVP
jgi:cytosine/creatinine deaminase